MVENILNLNDDEFDQVYPDSFDPVWSEAFDKDVRIPNSHTVDEKNSNLTPALHASELTKTPFSKAQSMMGHPIKYPAVSPLVDLEDALERLERATQKAGNATLSDTSAAQEALDILLGRTQGRFYDGFPLLNYNASADKNVQLPEGRIPGEYKMKSLEKTGRTRSSPIDGQQRPVWHLTVNMIWYGQNFDADTFLLRIPVEADLKDTLEIRWRVYSTVQEDLAPTTVLSDGTNSRIFHALDSTFISLDPNHLNEITIQYPSLQNLRGIYTWGWGLHPPRIQFIQPVRRVKRGEFKEGEPPNGSPNGAKEVDSNDEGWEPVDYSFVKRNRELSIGNIGSAAPEKKAYRVLQEALCGKSGSAIKDMLADPEVEPKGSFRQWMNLASNQRHLPDEAWDKIKDEPGVDPIDGKLGPYDAVIAYANNEMYGLSAEAPVNTEGRKGSVIKDFEQGDTVKIKAINLDNHTHYYRNVDFGARLVEAVKETFTNGKFSFEKFNAKPSYGVPKVAEMQWRTGWGYVPHRGVLQQSAVFPRPRDREQLQLFTDQFGNIKQGYQFTKTANGFFRFNPPAAIRAGFGHPESSKGTERDALNPDRQPGISPGSPLQDKDFQEGIRVGRDTEGFGTAKMPPDSKSPRNDYKHPKPGIPLPPQYPNFLRNDEKAKGGDIIPPTPEWSPFLVLHPLTGELETPECEYWVDQTYQHGRPIPANSAIEANVEAPRASAQLFYQFDPLFHDNAIFSFHPSSDIPR